MSQDTASVHPPQQLEKAATNTVELTEGTVLPNPLTGWGSKTKQLIYHTAHI